MELTARPYRNDMDRAEMRQLLVIGRQANISASYMHPGVLDWATHSPPDERENRRNILIWERVDGGRSRLEAWAIFLPDEGSFDLFMHPKLHGKPFHQKVMDEFVVWAERRAREGGLSEIWPFWAMEYDTVLIRLMRDRGYVLKPTDPAPPLFERMLDALPSQALPGGFTVGGVHSLDDARLRARVTYDAFRSSNDWEKYWDDYRQFFCSAIYDGQRDLLVRSPDGRGASACTIWFDEVNGIGLFEPVATHPDFEGQGLGKVVMTEGLRRMKDAGMQRVILGFDPANAAARGLYESMGFETACCFATYSKTLK